MTENRGQMKERTGRLIFRILLSVFCRLTSVLWNLSHGDNNLNPSVFLAAFSRIVAFQGTIFAKAHG